MEKWDIFKSDGMPILVKSVSSESEADAFIAENGGFKRKKASGSGKDKEKN